MADKKISQLTGATTPLAGTEELPLVQGGATKKVAASNFLLPGDIGSTVQGYDADTAKYDDATANFTGTLQNGGSNVVVDTDIGSTVQAYDADTAKYDDTTANFTGTLQNGGSNVVVDTDIGSTVQGYDADTAKLDTAQTWAANQNLADYLLQRPTLKDYAIEGSAIGNTGAAQTFDLEVANFFTATLDQNSTFTFSNPPGSGDFGGFVLALTNGGAYTITWPASVDWAGGNAPTLTSSGLDILVFVTYDAGTTWHGVVSSLDSK